MFWTSDGSDYSLVSGSLSHAMTFAAAAVAWVELCRENRGTMLKVPHFVGMNGRLDPRLTGRAVDFSEDRVLMRSAGV